MFSVCCNCIAMFNVCCICKLIAMFNVAMLQCSVVLSSSVSVEVELHCSVCVGLVL